MKPSETPANATVAGERFISEALTPVQHTIDPRRMALGEPSLPQQFLWRKKKLEIAEVVESWKSTSPCTHGSDESYVRKHWYRVRTTAGEELKIYFERRPRARSGRGSRWWLFSLKAGTP